MDELSTDLKQLLAKVAWLYHVDNLTQLEIAKRLQLSRPKVGRLLQRALDSGVLEIRLADDVSANIRLSRQLEDTFGLHEVIIINSTGDHATDRRMVGKATALYLQRVLHGNFLLGVGIGLTVNEIFPFIKPSPHLAEGTIVGISGGFSYPEISSIEISGRLAEKIGVRAETIFAPFILEDTSARDVLMVERNVKGQLEKAARSTMIVTGIGSYDDMNHFCRLGYIDSEMKKRLSSQHAVGEILGQFYDIDGHHISNILDERMIGLSLDQLRNIPSVVGLATGEQKAQALIGGVRNGVIKVLVLDDKLANKMLSLVQHVE